MCPRAWYQPEPSLAADRLKVTATVSAGPAAVVGVMTKPLEVGVAAQPPGFPTSLPLGNTNVCAEPPGPRIGTSGGGETLTAVGPAQVVDWLPTTPVGGFTKADAVAPMPGAKAPVLHTLRGGGRA